LTGFQLTYGNYYSRLRLRSTEIPMPTLYTAIDEIADTQVQRPHVVVLGAGASLAAFPKGDRLGRRLPVMKDFVNVVGLQPVLAAHGLGDRADENFEDLYSDLHGDIAHYHPMPRRHLTAPPNDRIKKPAIGQVDHFDKGYPGLALRVSYGGSRSWVYFYRWGGKQKRLTLGQWPTLDLTGARDAWRAARESLSKGWEPTAQVLFPMGTPAASGTVTFKAVLADWLKRDQAANRSRDEVKRILEKEALPVWGEVPLGAIGRRQVLELTDTIADRGAVTLARRCHAHLHRMFRWSVGRGIIEGNPVTDLPKPGAEVKRKRVLSDEELALAWKAAEKIRWPMGRISQLLILTLARRDEIGELRWSEIDLERNEIRLEDPRTKNGEPHIIPLSAPRGS
jgi:Arm DNA-binding domain